MFIIRGGILLNIQYFTIHLTSVVMNVIGTQSPRCSWITKWNTTDSFRRTQMPSTSQECTSNSWQEISSTASKDNHNSNTEPVNSSQNNIPEIIRNTDQKDDGNTNLQTQTMSVFPRYEITEGNSVSFNIRSPDSICGCPAPLFRATLSADDLQPSQSPPDICYSLQPSLIQGCPWKVSNR